MQLKIISLLSEEEYKKFRKIIPAADSWWWLKTASEDSLCVRVVNKKKAVCNSFYDDIKGGIRPYCIFALEPADSIFWHKLEAFIGSQIEIHGLTWTIVAVEPQEIKVVCDSIIARSAYNTTNNLWENSLLKKRLERDFFEIFRCCEVNLCS